MNTDPRHHGIFDASGDLARFKGNRAKIETLLAMQQGMWTGQPRDWIVIPLDRTPSVFALVARDNEGERHGREVVGAFVGPATGRLTVECLDISSGTHADVVLRAQGIRNVVALVPQRPATDAELLSALESLVNVRSTQPPSRIPLRPSLPFLLRDYWLSLQQQDVDASAVLLVAIEHTGQLNAENLRFLRVDRLAALGRWAELIADPMFADLAKTRRPRHISDCLLQALWICRVMSTDGIMTARQALDRFEAEQLGDQFMSLLRSVDVPDSAGARRLVAVFSVLTGNHGRVERLSATATEAEVSFIQDLLAAHKGSVPGGAAQNIRSSMRDAAQLLAEEDWEGVFQAAEESPDGTRLVETAIRAAFMSDDSAYAKRAIDLLAATGDSHLSQSPQFRKVLRAVREAAVEGCHSWQDWMERIERAQQWLEAASVLRSEADSWDISVFSSGSASATAAHALLSGSTGDNADQVRAVLDRLCLLAERLTLAGFGHELVDAILLVIRDQDNSSSQVREALRGLLESQLFEAGPSAIRYEEFTSVAAEMWEKVQASSTLDWGLDIAELLRAASCPSEHARLGFVQLLVAWCLAHSHQLNYRQRVVLNSLAQFVGLGEVLPPPQDSASGASIWARLNGVLVGVYSLLPHARERLSKCLAPLAPKVRIEQNSDMVSTDALRWLAANADYMIVDTWHAKHQATSAIDKVLARDRQLLPRGGGLASWLAVLQERLESEG